MLIYLFLLVLSPESAVGKLVTYSFDINLKKVNFTGEEVEAMAISNQIPGPTIKATVGDVLQVTFKNNMDKETSIHWHGVLLPNDQDGVPYLTTQPIAPHSSFTYKYKIRHSGTYWYHSHTGLQEQRGVYGSIVFYPKKGERIKSNKDYLVVLSDWTNENPKQVIANLKKDGDYYALKKKSVQSWDQVIRFGMKAIKNRLLGSFFRMGPMDISDVGYDAFLTNGKKEENLQARQGDKVRIRLINAAASTYFNVEFAGGLMTVVSADGVDVEPFKVKRLKISMAETYDVIVSIKKNRQYELRATAEDGTGKSSTFIGKGKKVLAPDIPKPNLFLLEHGTKKTAKNYMNNYDRLRSLKRTSFDSAKPRREVTLNLTGNMEKYVWSFNNKTLGEADQIMIKKGEVVRFILKNNTMMNHPLHLHGHFFRVLNKHKEKSPLKHTVNVPAMKTVIIEFDANENKDWLFHCHNLYHMKSGMTRVISYKKSSQVTPEILKKLTVDNWYYKIDVSLLYNMTAGVFKISNTRNYFEVEYDCNYKKEHDVELIYARNLTKFFDIYVGGNFEHEAHHKNSKNTFVIGVKYVLPFFIESVLQINSERELRLSLGSHIQLTERAQFSWVYNTDQEYRLNLNYEINKKLSLATSYDSDFKWGLGLKLAF